jgi:hypothetical protein
MDEQVSNATRYLNAADEYFELARNAPTPFVKAYYERVAPRYLSTEGEFRRQSGTFSFIGCSG